MMSTVAPRNLLLAVLIAALGHTGLFWVVGQRLEPVQPEEPAITVLVGARAWQAIEAQTTAGRGVEAQDVLSAPEAELPTTPEVSVVPPAGTPNATPEQLELAASAADEVPSAGAEPAEDGGEAELAPAVAAPSVAQAPEPVSAAEAEAAAAQTVVEVAEQDEAVDDAIETPVSTASPVANEVSALAEAGTAGPQALQPAEAAGSGDEPPSVPNAVPDPAIAPLAVTGSMEETAQPTAIEAPPPSAEVLAAPPPPAVDVAQTTENPDTVEAAGSPPTQDPPAVDVAQTTGSPDTVAASSPPTSSPEANNTPPAEVSPPEATVAAGLDTTAETGGVLLVPEAAPTAPDALAPSVPVLPATAGSAPLPVTEVEEPALVDEAQPPALGDRSNDWSPVADVVEPPQLREAASPDATGVADATSSSQGNTAPEPAQVPDRAAEVRQSASGLSAQDSVPALAPSSVADPPPSTAAPVTAVTADIADAVTREESEVVESSAVPPTATDAAPAEPAPVSVREVSPPSASSVAADAPVAADTPATVHTVQTATAAPVQDELEIRRSELRRLLESMDARQANEAWHDQVAQLWTALNQIYSTDDSRLRDVRDLLAQWYAEAAGYHIEAEQFPRAQSLLERLRSLDATHPLAETRQRTLDSARAQAERRQRTREFDALFTQGTADAIRTQQDLLREHLAALPSDEAARLRARWADLAARRVETLAVREYGNAVDLLGSALEVLGETDTVLAGLDPAALAGPLPREAEIVSAIRAGRLSTARQMLDAQAERSPRHPVLESLGQRIDDQRRQAESAMQGYRSQRVSAPARALESARRAVQLWSDNAAFARLLEQAQLAMARPRPRRRPADLDVPEPESGPAVAVARAPAPTPAPPPAAPRPPATTAPAVPSPPSPAPDVTPRRQPAPALPPAAASAEDDEESGVYRESQRPCSSRLAGRGRRSYAVCYDAVRNGSRGPLLVVIPAGDRVRSVFAIGKYEVTVREFNAFCIDTAACQPRQVDPRLPATDLSGQVIIQYLGWLTAQTGQRYRLPTDREWLHAANAGGRQPPRDFNCRLQSGNQIVRGRSLLSTRIGTANPWGLMNFVGNARELVTAGANIVALGGSFRDPMQRCGIELVQPAPGGPDDATGFRVVREL